MRRIQFLSTTVLVGSFFATARPMAAQSAPCVEARDSLMAGVRGIERWGSLTACGAFGANAIGLRLLAVGAETDTSYLDALMSVAITMRDTTLLRGSRVLANTTGNAVAARILGLNLLLAQYSPRATLIGLATWTEVLSHPRGDDCRGTVSVVPMEFVGPMPGNTAAQAAATLDSILFRATEGAIIRDFALCVREAIAKAVPIAIPVAYLSASHVCGTMFQVSNSAASPIPARLHFRMKGTTKTGGLYVRPGESSTFLMARYGDVEILQNSTVIATVANRGKACP